MACMAKLKVMNSHWKWQFVRDLGERAIAVASAGAFACCSGERRTYHRVKTSEGSSNGKTGETRLGDGTVNDSLLAESVQETLGDLVSMRGKSTLVVCCFRFQDMPTCHALLGVNLSRRLCCTHATRMR